MVISRDATELASYRQSHKYLRFLFWIESAVSVVGLLLVTDPRLRGWSGLTQTNNGSSSSDPGNTLLFATYMLVLLFSLIHYEQILRVTKKALPLLVLVAVAFLSIQWSIQPTATKSAALWLAGTTLFGIYFGSRFTLRQQINILCVVVICAAVLSIIAVKLFPEVAIGTGSFAGDWQGIYLHKNRLGRIMSLGVMLFVIRISRYNIKDLFYIAGLLLCAFLLVKSDSSSGLVVALAVILTRLGLDFLSKDRALYKSLIISASITAAGLILAILANPSEAAALVGRTGTLTGRTTLWAYLMNFVHERPWTGYGFDAFWSRDSITLEIVQRSVYWAPNHAHNGVLEVLLDLGVLGLILLGLIWLSVFVRAMRLALARNSLEARWPLMYVVFYTLWVIPEAAALGPAQINFLLLVAVFSYLIVQRSVTGPTLATDQLSYPILLEPISK